MINIDEHIIELIESRVEGDYWDFKEYYHENTASLLHDIICMANNRSDRDAYIIFGVRNEDFKVTGVETDIHRKNQQQMIDQLKDKKFAGGIRPIIYLRTLKIGVHEIDVLIIKNTNDTPYYLIEDYRDKQKVVRAQYIYTRVGDTNTDITKGADINHIEYLWRKRFMLNKSPLEQIVRRLSNKDEWVSVEDYYYNKFNPEYTINLSYDEDNYVRYPEFYSYAMYNESTTYGTLTIKSYGTKLYSTQYAILDSGRYVTPTPKWAVIEFDRCNKEERYDFKYFIKDDIDYRLKRFLLNENSHEANYACDRLSTVILIFKDSIEKDKFISYVYSNKELFESYFILESKTYEYIQCSNDLETKQVKKRLKTGVVLNKILKGFRAINKE